MEMGIYNPDWLSSLATRADALIAAGDIHNGKRAVDILAQSPIPVFYVLGNHEFYHHDYWELRENFPQHPNVRVMFSGRPFYAPGVRIVGDTLWTDYAKYGEDMVAYSMRLAASGLNDHRLIRNGGDKFWTPEDAKAEHTRQLNIIKGELKQPFDGKTIVITHHAPTAVGEPRRYAQGKLSPAFVSNLDYLFDQVDLWVFGHTHYCMDRQFGRCRVVSNQRGYEGELPGFKVKVVEV